MAVRETTVQEAASAVTAFPGLPALQQAEQRLAHDPEAILLLQRVSQLMLQKLACPGGPLQQASHRTSTLALDDLGLLTELVIEAWRHEPHRASRVALLRLRGEQALAQLLQNSGGTLRPAEVQQLLGLSGEGVRKRRDRKRLLGWRHGKHTIYPAFQFDQEHTRVWPALETVLPLLDTESGPAQLRFLLSPDPELGDTPAALLCRDEPVAVEKIACKARQFGQHLAR
jgi:hypothetical protein